MWSILFTAFLFSHNAKAVDDFCTPLEVFQEKVFFCEEDVAYAQEGIACRDRFRSLVEAKKLELTKILKADAARALGDAQNLKFQTTQVSYESTDKMLVELINIGRHARAEVYEYGDDFVAPFSYPARDLGPFPGLHHPVVQELFRIAPCYKDNMESIEQTLADFDLMLQQLQNSRVKTAELHKSSNHREKFLDELSQPLEIRGGKNAITRGKSLNSASDVTGLKEDKAKTGRLPAGGVKKTISKEDLQKFASSSSALTGRRYVKEVLSSFEPIQNGVPNGSAPKGASSSEVAGGGKDMPVSAGSVLWEENGTQAREGGDLELKKSAIATNIVRNSRTAENPQSQEMQFANSEAPLPLGSVASAGGESNLQEGSPRSISATIGNKGDSAVLSQEVDLFVAVSDRYKASELFRKAKIIHVPLGSFDPNLKR